MKPGTRKLGITIGALLSLLSLAGLAAVLGLSDSAVDSIASSLALVAIGYCGGNGIEHLSSAIARRST